MSVIATLIVASAIAGDPRIVETIETDCTEVHAVAYSKDVESLYAVLYHHGRQRNDGRERDYSTIEKIDLDSGVATWKLKSDNVCTALAVSPDGDRIATAGFDDVVEIRDSDTGHVITTIDIPRYYFHGVQELQFVDDATALVACGSGQALYAVIETGKTTLLGVTFPEKDLLRLVRAWAISDELDLAAAGTSAERVQFVQFGKSKPVKPFGEIRIVSISVFDFPAIWATAFAPGGTLLAVSYNYGLRKELRFVRIDGAREEFRLEVPYSVKKMFFVDDEDEIVVLHSAGASVWNLVDKIETGSVALADSSVVCAAYCPSRREVAVAQHGGTITRISLGSQD